MFLLFRELSGTPDRIALAPEETRHARARRLEDGASAAVGDGLGRRYSGRLAAGLREWMRDPAMPVESRREPRVRLYCAWPERNRADWLLQKATELGATTITPLRLARSTPQRAARERSERILMEAAVQSGRFVLPHVDAELDLERALAARHERPASSGDFALLLDPRAARGVRDFAEPARAALLGPESELALFVGPEGGFTEAELQAANAAGVQSARLGETILRVETAALAGLAWLASLV
jgi:16S rRNA (uracil1498-N3)-methyltransferase